MGIAKESTWGTRVAAEDYVYFVSENLSEKLEEVNSESIRANRDLPDFYQGQFTCDGDIVLEVYPDTIGYFLRSALGQPSEAQQEATSAYKHTFTPTDTPFHDDCALYPYTLEIYRDLDTSDEYTGCVVDSLAFEWSVSTKILRATAGIIAKTRADLEASSDSFQAIDPFVWHQGAIVIGSANTDLESLTININNNQEPVFLLDGAQTPAKILPTGFREFTLSGVFGIIDDHTEYDKFIAGTETDWVITFTGATIESTYKYTLAFTLKDVVYRAYPLGVSGPNRQTVAFEARAQYDSDAGYSCLVELTNEVTDYNPA
jgi:hypothetical protein